MTQTNEKPLLLIGIDSASTKLVEQGMAEGWLPNLAGLRRRGAWGPIHTMAKYFASSVWLSFATGTRPQKSGYYFYLQWRSDEMGTVRLDPQTFAHEPFWRELARNGKRTIAVDAPYSAQPRPHEGVEIHGWASHDNIFPSFAWPAEIKSWLAQRFGAEAKRLGKPMADELYEPQSLEGLLRIRDELIETAQQTSELSCSLIREKPWDLFITVLGAVHRAGHLFWDQGGVAGAADASTDKLMNDALRDIYIAADRAVGEIIDAAPSDARIWVCSLHGMRQNISRIEVLPTMLSRVLAGGPPSESAPSRPGLLKRLRKKIPVQWRSAVKSRLPFALQDKLSAFWNVGQIDWAHTQAVSLYGDVNGYVRINLRGREREGVVEPGAEYDALCAKITEGLKTFVDTDTGQPIVSEILHRNEICGPGDIHDVIPDLVVRWTDTPSWRHRQIISSSFGAIDWPTPGKNPNGRSGNHDDGSFLLIADDQAAPGATIDDADIVDLSATVYALFNQTPPAHVQGRCLNLYRKDVSASPIQ